MARISTPVGQVRGRPGDHTYLGSSRPAPASKPEPWADYAYVITSIRVC